MICLSFHGLLFVGRTNRENSIPLKTASVTSRRRQSTCKRRHYSRTAEWRLGLSRTMRESLSNRTLGCPRRPDRNSPTRCARPAALQASRFACHEFGFWFWGGSNHRAPAFSAHKQSHWRNHMSQSVARTLANQRQMPYGAKYINPQLGGPPPSLAAAILIFAPFPLRAFRRARAVASLR
jgi:hypothetical protein